jgi:hypothetical protein
MAVHRKAPVILATVLTLAIAGTALASVRGTTLKMGVTNSLTGNYITAFYATVAGPALLIRNGSTSSLSSAIRAWAPYGGTPLDLVARAGFPVMKVSNTVKIANLNADLLDNFSASVSNVANTIAVRDGAGAINANLNGNASTVGGFAANGLTRVARGGSSATTAFNTSTATPYGTVSIVAPAAGFVKVDASLTVIDSSCASDCYVTAYLRHQGPNTISTFPAQTYFDEPLANVALTWVFPVNAGTNTFETASYGQTGVSGWYAQMSAHYSPFGSTGAGTLGGRQSGGTPALKELP